MDVGTGIWYVAKLLMLLIVVVIALILAIVLPRKRKFAGPWRAISAPVLGVVVAVLAWMSAARPSWLWLAVALVIGASLGLFMGRAAKPTMRGQKPAVSRWVMAPLLLSLGLVVLSIMTLFGTSALAALAMMWVTFAWAMQAGAEVGEFSVRPKAAPPASPEAPVPVPVGAPVAPAAPPTYATPEPAAAVAYPPPVFTPEPAPEVAPRPAPVVGFPPPPVFPRAEPPEPPPQE